MGDAQGGESAARGALPVRSQTNLIRWTACGFEQAAAVSTSTTHGSNGDPPLGDKYARIVNDMARQGWSVRENFLDDALTAMLMGEALRLRAAGAYRHAGVGRGETAQVRPALRSDRIAWLDGKNESGATLKYLRELETLRQALNGSLFLGLFDFEGHLAEYVPGAFYRRHLDQHHDSDDRVVSCVLYLNRDWIPADGGELRLYLPDLNGQRDIAPRAGTLVCFLSGAFEHEVLPVHKSRHSLSGWFRRRAL